MDQMSFIESSSSTATQSSSEPLGTQAAGETLWWAALRHGGCLIAPARLAEFFPASPEPLPSWLAERLRRALNAYEEYGDAPHLATLLDTVLEQILGLEPTLWTKAGAVDPATWSVKTVTGETIRPRRLWQEPGGGLLPVFFDDEVSGRGTGLPHRLGLGRSRRAVARVVEWLRKQTDARIALLTNGRQWRLIHAGADYDAWCEWDTEMWFEEGQPGLQVQALRLLLGRPALTASAADQPPPLVAAILATRRGQAELSAVLGERVRQSVECLIRESQQAIEALEADPVRHVTRRDIYTASVRVVMRLVVILFAEARELLPVYDTIYRNSYGLQGLREQLDLRSGGHAAERLRHAWSAWPRLLALFRLLYHGSGHGLLTIMRYGGGLFEPGDPDSADPILRALAALETPECEISDAAVAHILTLLTCAPVKVRQGRTAMTVIAPVDFSQLDTEYIGILYEGLLDYELRKSEGLPVIFLNLGDQPALPLAMLEAMSDKQLSALVEKFKVKAAKSSGDDEGDEEVESADCESEEIEDETAEAIAVDTVSDTEIAVGVDGDIDQTRMWTERARAWAAKAVIAGGLLPKPRGKMTPEKQRDYEQAIQIAARGLVAQVILPGMYYLVRWGGTRKGAGTFYTKPALARPTVRRTLEPLFMESESGQVADPERILSLKVCDPACGSGSFLVSATRTLTRALCDSLFIHSWLREREDGQLEPIPPLDARPEWFRKLLPDLLVPAENPRQKLSDRLTRIVVEQCIYGVDLDPLAVELAHLALWIESMNRALPFSFIDHKVKCGNALVGCWFDRFQDYPAMAWEREGGDKGHNNGVHFAKEAWTRAIKQVKQDVVRLELERVIRGDGDLFKEFDLPAAPEAIHEEAIRAFTDLHHANAAGQPDYETQASIYRKEFTENEDIRRLRLAFDTWCAVWFWPADKLEIAPTPLHFYDPPEATRQEIARLAEEHHFFHWEIEFPDVFTGLESGFDAIVGNPPWEIQKPNSLEFFSNIDPLYRTYGNQEAQGKQREVFQREREVEHRWLEYNARLKALTNWTRSAGFPFGDLAEPDGGRFSLSRKALENRELHEIWRKARSARSGYADSRHPFQHQGSADVNTYKLFLEQSYNLLCLDGRLGMIVPSGIISDKGATELRRLFLERSRWDFAFGFINWNKIFESVYYRFKFCIVGVQKGGSTQKVQVAFSRYHIQEWEEAEKYFIPYPGLRVRTLSPKSWSFLEARTAHDLTILEKMYIKGILLGDNGPDGWGIRYASEFHMTNDSKLFPPRPEWETKGHQPDEYGHWIKGNWRACQESYAAHECPVGRILSRDGNHEIEVEDIEDVALPLYEGRMIGQFDFANKGWVSGKGRGAIWRDIEWDAKVIEPQYLMGMRVLDEELLRRHIDAIKKAEGVDAAEEESERLREPDNWCAWRLSGRNKLLVMDVGSATNMRTAYASMLDYFPCGNSVPALSASGMRVLENNFLMGILNSIPYDSLIRARIGGLHLNWHYLEETALLKRDDPAANELSLLVARLAMPATIFAREWLEVLASTATFEKLRSTPWRKLWIVTHHERMRTVCMLDAIVAHLYGLQEDDFRWMLRDCDHPLAAVNSKDFMRTLDPKGFWRVGKDQPPELRQTALAQVAFADLQTKGLDVFLAQNDGEGWMLPETLRLADYGLGHDERARQPQPVAPLLGPRFYDFQLNQSAEESWEECRRHAENIRLIRSIGAPATNAVAPASVKEKRSKTAEPKSSVIEAPDMFGLIPDAEPSSTVPYVQDDESFPSGEQDRLLLALILDIIKGEEEVSRKDLKIAVFLAKKPQECRKLLPDPKDKQALDVISGSVNLTNVKGLDIRAGLVYLLSEGVCGLKEIEAGLLAPGEEYDKLRKGLPKATMELALLVRTALGLLRDHRDEDAVEEELLQLWAEQELS